MHPEHACSIADKLGIQRILIHKWSSLLSAYGISQAQLQYEASEPLSGTFSLDELPRIRERLSHLRAQVTKELASQGARTESLRFDEILSLRYFGTDTNLSIRKPDDEDYGRAFVAEHLREFAFNLERRIVIDSIQVRGSGNAGATEAVIPPGQALSLAKTQLAPAEAFKSHSLYVEGQWRDARVYRLADVVRGTYADGPALLLDETQTIFVEPSFRAYILDDHVVMEKLTQGVAAAAESADAFSPIQLSVFAHRFMSIAEQMGNTLQRTAISTSIRERLDFSCAIFSADGQLVANAPHIPIHLGSMQLAIQAQHELWRGKLQPGDVLMTNHPEWGGTHLPDVTVVTPVFEGGEICFYTASRGHHTDIGKYTVPTYM